MTRLTECYVLGWTDMYIFWKNIHFNIWPLPRIMACFHGFSIFISQILRNVSCVSSFPLSLSFDYLLYSPNKFAAPFILITSHMYCVRSDIVPPMLLSRFFLYHWIWHYELFLSLYILSSARFCSFLQNAISAVA